jgi:pilus assembly protein Flp/PilA
MLRSMSNLPRSPSMNLFRRFLKDESGATAIEYALIAALMAAAIIAAMAVLSPAIIQAFTNIGATLTGNT